MKKLIFCLILLFSLTIPISISADTKYYSIDRLLINVEIQNNRDILVNDEFTYTFNGDFNGIYLNLNLNGSTGYSINNVTIEDNGRDYVLENKNDKSNNSYEIINTNDKVQVKIYSKSSNESKKFKVEYLVKSAAIKYEDFSSLNWSFYTASLENPVHNIELNLKLNSSNFNANNLYYTVYGDGNFITDTSENNIKITGENLTSDLGVDLRFQPEFLTIPSIQKHENLDTIDNNRDLKEDSSNDLLFLIIPFSLILLIALFFYFLHKRSKRIFNEALNEYRSNFVFIKDDLLTYPPSNTSPALVAYLYDKNYTDWSIVPSTLMYLTNKGFYTLCSSSSNENQLINVNFKRVKDSSECEYSHLKVLMDWFKEYETNNNEFSLNLIRKEVEDNKEFSKKFYNSYWDFINEIRLNGRFQEYYINIKDIEVLNNHAYSEYLKWSAYKKYLLSLINSKEIYNIKESIIYAPALGIDYYDLEINLDDSDDFEDSSNFYNNLNPTFYNYYMTNIFLFNEIYNLTDDYYDNSSNFDNSIDFSNNSFNDFSSGSDFSGGGGGDSGAF